eukprot:CAMPEP_0177651460 /NCGR_PEP_ID=MMETSP0447-20121125/12560_1 /TAXON_ID=0 /ORGANISM="Stygamoeba regulata, Strain BSH-02190019" /LENGTH=86 /DNA_ID=CAMNT_0019154543 /DNA_START=46 /DNA_END=306 /DNA_ORIENTATION=+
MDGDQPSDQISLKVSSNDGQEVFFKIKKTTPLKKLMEAFCTRQGVSMGTIRFIHEGRRLNPEDTPEGLGMENEDIIDALLEQTGGF